MERMNETERFMSLFALLSLVMLFALAFYVVDMPERMARDGFLPLRLMGTSDIYWVKVPEDYMAKKEKDLLFH